MPSKLLKVDSEKEHEPHPVYSDYSHMPMNTMAFAVNLREEPGTDILGKILPLTKIIPKDSSPKRASPPKKPSPKKKVITATCEREDCGLRKGHLADLKLENESFRVQQKSVELSLESAKNKKSLIEKSIQISQDKNEALKVDLESVQARIESIEVELSTGDDGSDKIKDRMTQIQQEILVLKTKIEKDSTDIERLNESKNAGSMRFAPAGSANKESAIYAEETRRLDKYEVDDSDEEDS